MSKRQQIPASALSYAISFMLLTGLVSAALLFIASANKRLETVHLMREHVLLNNLTSLKWGLNQSEDEALLLHSSGDTSEVRTKDWGVYRMVHVKTKHRLANVEKTAIGGVYNTKTDLPALYVPNKTDQIQLCGSTLLEGNIYISERGLKRGHIARKSFSRDKLYVGSLNVSDKKLPALNILTDFMSYERIREDSELLSSLPSDSAFSFYGKTSLFSSLDALEIANNLRGNLVVHSFDQIRVRALANLENIILIAPRIIIEKGFSGTLQAFASEEIFCEEEVNLLYPSALVMLRTERTEAQGRIFMDKGSRVIGGVLLYDADPYFRNPLNLELNEAMVGGVVYNTGESEIRGEVYGSLFTQKLLLHAGGGSYDNYLLDATISSVQVPERMIYPTWVSQLVETKADLIACF